MNHRFQQTCLLLIVILLAIVAFRPHEKEVAAAEDKYKVAGVVANVSESQLEAILRAMTKDGWSLDSTVPNQRGTLLVFKK